MKKHKLCGNCGYGNLHWKRKYNSVIKGWVCRVYKCDYCLEEVTLSTPIVKLEIVKVVDLLKEFEKD